jgi:hypothetical protein
MPRVYPRGKQTVRRIVKLFYQMLLRPIGERQLGFALLGGPALAHVENEGPLPDAAQIGLAIGHAGYVLCPSLGVGVLREQHGGQQDNANQGASERCREDEACFHFATPAL